MARPHLTIIASMGGRAYGANLSRSGGLQVTSCGVAGSPVEACSAVLKESADIAREVWVISDSIWFGEVELQGSAVVGLSDTELAEAAGYEAEGSGGLSPLDAITAVRRVRVPEADDRFLTAQVPHFELVEIGKLLKRYRARLAGMLHPAGAPFPINSTSDGDDWARLEFWAEEIVLVRRSSGQLDVHATGVLPGRNCQTMLQNVLRQVHTEQHRECLTAAGVDAGNARWPNVAPVERPRWHDVAEDTPPVPEAESSGLDLNDDADVERLLHAWLQALAAGAVVTPVLKKPKGPPSRIPQLLVGAVSTLAVVGLLYWQHDIRQHELGQLRERAAEAQQAQTDIRLLKGHVKAEKSKAVEVSKALNDVENALAAKRRKTGRVKPQIDMRPKVAAMLSGLSAVNDEVVIRSITPNSPSHRVRGIATNPGAITRMTQRLSARLSRHWLVAPAELTPISSEEGVAWEFAILLEPRLTETSP